METDTYIPFVLVDEARAWIVDEAPDRDAADVWQTACSDDVMDFIRRNYSGGVMAFTADVYAYYGFGTLAAYLRDQVRAEKDEAR